MCNMNEIQKYYIRHVVITMWPTNVNCLAAIHKSSPVASWDSKVKVSSDVYFRISLAEFYEYYIIIHHLLYLAQGKYAVSDAAIVLFGDNSLITLLTSDLNTESGWFNKH